jgi:hypothetical protein
VGSSDTLVLPQVTGGEVLGLWISSSESLSDPSVVQLLSVAELHEADTSSDESTEDNSAEALMQVNVEVVWSSFLATHEVGECEPSSHGGEDEGLGATSELVVVVDVEEAQVERLWVVLDQLNWSDFLRQLSVVLLDVSGVTLDAWTVTSHFLFINYFIRINTGVI